MMNRSTVVLLIEDDPTLGPLTVDMLAAHGHSPTLAVSYEQAFQLLTAPHRIEVAILDLQLGNERGDSLIEKLRRAGAKMPAIIVFSAQSMPDLVQAAKTVRAEAILQKPCSAHRMIEAIELAVA